MTKIFSNMEAHSRITYLAIVFLLSACVLRNPNTRKCTLEQMIVQPSALTSGARATTIVHPLKNFEGVSAEISYELGDSTILHSIEAYLKPDYAAEDYLKNQLHEFSESRYGGEYVEIPVGFKNVKATQMKIACNNGSESLCKMLAQYGRYYVRFSVSHIDNMGLSDFMRTVQSIDTKMEFCLSN